MRSRFSVAILSVLAISGAVLADATATLTLVSTQSGQSVSPGAPIDWTIKLAISTGDNAGLALVCVDLVQDETNPAFFDLPPGSDASIDATMGAFSRPLGISNPGEGGATTGYIGVQRGAAGHKNLVQIGGGQNTFGAAGPTGIGQDYTVDAGVGQGAQPQIVLSGSFAAPAVAGSYGFHLANGLVNVLTAVNPPPAFSPVAAATANLAGASFAFTVGTATVRGDLNCDGAINAFDIDAFVQCLVSGTPTAPCTSCQNGDVNCDGGINAFDIDPFVECLVNGCPPCP